MRLSIKSVSISVRAYDFMLMYVNMHTQIYYHDIPVYSIKATPKLTLRAVRCGDLDQGATVQRVYRSSYGAHGLRDLGVPGR